MDPDTYERHRAAATAAHLADYEWARRQTVPGAVRYRPTLPAEAIVTFANSGVVLDDVTRLEFAGWYDDGNGGRGRPRLIKTNADPAARAAQQAERDSRLAAPDMLLRNEIHPGERV